MMYYIFLQTLGIINISIYLILKMTLCCMGWPFRGMLTPSEYRAFMREAEKATQETEQSDSNNQTSQQVKDLDDNKTNLLNVNLSEITATRGLRNEC